MVFLLTLSYSRASGLGRREVDNHELATKERSHQKHHGETVYTHHTCMHVNQQQKPRPAIERYCW